ncbi:MAG: BTAD domain-containing putative transcriptional regulator [Caldilineaceae bacterium]
MDTLSLHPLSIRLLGALEIQLGDQPVKGFISSKAQALLIYLAVTRRPWNRSILATLCWGDMNERAARRNLTKALSNLRRLVGDYLQIERQTVAFRPTKSHWLDVTAFEQGVTANAVTALQHAVKLYQGDLLPGFFVADAPDFEAWLRAERERLHGLCCVALTSLMAHAGRTNDLRQAIGWAQQLLTLEPTDEQAHRQLMQLYMRSGQRSNALAQYAICCERLAQELAVEPDGTTTALYEEIRADHALPEGEEFLAPTRLGVIPAALLSHQQAESRSALEQVLRQPSPFPVGVVNRARQPLPLIGREDAWQRLLATWPQTVTARTHFCLIHGEAGMGKTRLAEELLTWTDAKGIETARTRAYAAAGDLAYAPLIELLRTPPLQQALSRVDEIWRAELAQLLPELGSGRADRRQSDRQSLSVDESQWRRQRLFTALTQAFQQGEQPRVLLIDDLQWCDGETLAWLHYFLQAAQQGDDLGRALPPTLIIGTARPEIRHDAHPFTPMLLHLRSTGQITEIALKPLDVVATTNLASQVAEHEVTSDQANALYHYTEGNPLFVIELMRTAGWQSQLDKMREHQHRQAALFPAEASVPRLELPPKAQAVIQERLAQLSPVARRLVGLAAVIGRSFDFALLRQASTDEETAVVTGLDELWQQGIVRAHGHQRYDFSHDRIREVAYLAVGPVQRPLWHRQVALALAELNRADLAPVSAQVAFHFEETGDVERAIGYYQQAAARAHMLFADGDAVAMLYRALALVEALPVTRQNKTTELCILLQLVDPLMVAAGSFEPALYTIGLRAKALAEEIGEKVQLFQALSCLRVVHQLRAEYREAQFIAEQLVALADQLEADRIGSKVASIPFFIEAHYLLAHTHLYLGNFLSAQVHYDQILAFDATPFNPLSLATKNLWLLGYPDRSQDCANRAIAKAASQDRPYALAFVKTNLARLYHFMHEFTAMKQMTEESLALVGTQNNPLLLILIKSFQGRVLAEEGQAEQGIAQIRAMLAQLDAKQHTAFRTHFLSLLAEAYACANQFVKALDVLDQARVFVERNGERIWHAELVRLRGDYLLALATPPAEVLSCYDDAIAIAQAQQAKSLELRATMSLARLLQNQGETAVAYQRLSVVYNWFTEGFNTADLRAARALLAELPPMPQRDG